MNPKAIAFFHDASALQLAGYVFLFECYRRDGASHADALRAVNKFYS